MGLGSVGMAIAFAYGSCSLLGLAYGPLHNIIPFLLLGIGEHSQPPLLITSYPSSSWA